MRALRILLRWGLTLIASLLLIIMLALISLRVMPWHFRDVDLSVWRHVLPIPETVDGHADDLLISLEGTVLRLRVNGLSLDDHVSSNEVATLARGDIGVDLWHLFIGGSVVDTLMLDSPHLTLQQKADGVWTLFTPRRHASAADGHGMDWSSVDGLLEQLRGMDTAVRNAKVVLKGRERTMTFVMPSFVSTLGQEGQQHWDGEVCQPEGTASLMSLSLDSSAEHGAPWQLALRADGKQVGDLLTLLGSRRHYRIGLSGNINIGARWADHRLQDLMLGADIPSFMVVREDVVPRQWQQGALTLKGRLHWDGRQWLGQMSDMSLRTLDDKGRPGMSQLPTSATLSGDAHALQLTLPSFDITDLSMIWPWLPTSSGLRSGLAQMSPTGHVQSLVLTFGGSHGVLVDARVQQAHISSWDSIPGLGPWDGHIVTDTRNGTLDATLSQGARFSLPHVFPRDWQLESGNAHLAWQRSNENDWRLDVSPINVMRDGAHLKGSMALWAPEHGEGRFSLSLDATGALIKQSRDWLPTVALSPALGEWLADNIHRGRINRGHIGLIIPLEDELEKLERPAGVEHERHVDTDLSFDLSDVTLSYLPGWPALTGVSGHLSYAGERMDARIDEASLEGLRGREAEAHYADDRLTVKAPITGDASSLLSVLKQAPLSASLKQTIAEWQARGALNARLDVDVPFEDGKPVRVEAGGRFDRARLAIQPHNLVVDDLKGTARFLLANDVVQLTANADGHAFGGPAHATIAFRDTEGDVRVIGQADAAKALDWLAFRGLSPETHGMAPYTAHLELGDVTRLLVDSSLVGVTLPVPAPLGKQAADAAPLHVDMDLSHGNGSALIDKRLWARWRNEMTQGQLWIEHWPVIRQLWDDSPGWTVHWTTPDVSIDQWMPVIKALDMTAVGHQNASSNAAGADAAPAIRRLLVDTPCLSLLKQCLGQVRLVGNADDEGLWRIDTTGSLMAGRLTWLPGAKDHFDISLDRLTLDGLMGLMQSERQQEGHELIDEILAIPRPHVEPISLPETLDSVPNGQLSVARLVLNDKDSGHFYARWHALNDLLALDDMTLGFQGSTLDLRGRWMKAGSVSVTQGKARLTLGDFATLLDTFDQPEVVHTDNGGTIDMTFAWPGAPWQATLGTATGAIDSDIKAGRFMSIDSTSVRLVGLLNLNNILRRLRLDFTDVIHSGTAFNSIRGSGTFSDGILITRRPIEIDAAVTHFTADGQIDLLQRTVNQRVGVTVPIMQGLPVAALLTGLPQLGAVLLGTNWLFGDQLNRLTELHYRIEGSWDDPTFTMETVR